MLNNQPTIFSQDIHLRGIRACVYKLVDDFPFSHHQNLVTQVLQLLDFIRGNEHGDLLFCKLSDHLVNLGLRPHVNASGRLIQQNDLEIAGQPLADCNLLLVAAAQVSDNLGGRSTFDVEAIHDFGHKFFYRRPVNDSPLGAAVQFGQRQIVSNTPHQGQPVQFPGPPAQSPSCGLLLSAER